jgi:hypothetical protein
MEHRCGKSVIVVLGRLVNFVVVVLTHKPACVPVFARPLASVDEFDVPGLIEVKEILSFVCWHAVEKVLTPELTRLVCLKPNARRPVQNHLGWRLDIVTHTILKVVGTGILSGRVSEAISVSRTFNQLDLSGVELPESFAVDVGAVVDLLPVVVAS